jgi:hypothetical protein
MAGLFSTATPVYLIDHAVYKPPEELRVDVERCKVDGKSWKVRDQPGLSHTHPFC